METLEFKDRCLKHPQKKIEFIKINHSEHSASHPFFCCSICINEYDFINLKDYQSINYITESDPNEILRKWPPIQQQEIINKMIDITKGKESPAQIIEQIMTFFSNLKKQIIQSLDLQQKKIILIAEAIPEVMEKSEVIKQYQQISKIEELKNELLNINSSVIEKENICKELIQQSIASENVELLESLLDFSSQQTLFDSEQAVKKQQYILSSISNIKLLKNNSLQQMLSSQIDVQLKGPERGNRQRILKVGRNEFDQPYALNILQNGEWHYSESDITLNKNLKYIFRFQIDNLVENDEVHFGLMPEYNSFYDYQIEKLCCTFIQENNEIVKYNGYGDDQFILSEERQVELRISIKDKIVEIFDFPNYQYQANLVDRQDQNLFEADFLRLYFALEYEGNKITLIDSMTVSSFD